MTRSLRWGVLVPLLLWAGCLGTEDPVVEGEIRIDLAERGVPLPRELLGTNVPAWLGPATLEDPAFQEVTVASGASLLRMPGGSWANVYDWHGCEIADPERCWFVGAARPSDFIGFLEATGLPGMWTVSMYDTAQSAAALVGFFNGDIDDRRAIGTDRYGRDWGTVADWARLRVRGGHPEPVGLTFWEIGNEVYGGRPDSAGPSCPSFGWEDVWTCEGTDYVLGDETHDGFLDLREAMREIDSTIQVGLVGVSDPSSWGSWGDEVLAAVGDEFDFYVVHEYGFDSSPSVDRAMDRPNEQWPGAIRDLGEVLSGRPIAVTEYNLVAVGEQDTRQMMIRATGALYTADTIGQLARAGVTVAAHWNLANGVVSSGSDYGLVDSSTYEPYPQFDALRLWSRAGATLLSAEDLGSLHLYPTRHDDGRVAIVAINLGSHVMTPTLVLSGVDGAVNASIEGVWSSDPEGLAMEPVAPSALVVAHDRIEVGIQPYSINLIEVTPRTERQP